MTRRHMNADPAQLAAGLEARAPSTRLRAALAAGTDPHPDQIDVLVRRCALEPDFYVRDMLTWALTRHDRGATTERVLRELTSEIARARSQALHTLTKIGDRGTWPAIPPLLQDADDEVARTAWRAAVGLVPEGEKLGLAEVLATQLDRGGRDVQLSLSRAFVAMGGVAIPVIERAQSSPQPGVSAHALATAHLMANPDDGFDAAIAEARRVVALLAAPTVPG